MFLVHFIVCLDAEILLICALCSGYVEVILVPISGLSQSPLQHSSGLIRDL